MRDPISLRRIPLALLASVLLVGPFGSQATAEDTATRPPTGILRQSTPPSARTAPTPAAQPSRRTDDASAAKRSAPPKATPDAAGRTLRPDAARSAPEAAPGDEQAARRIVEQGVRRHQASVERKAREHEGASERFAQKQRAELERENASTLSRIRGLAKSSGRIEELRERVRALEKEAASASPERGASIAEEADALLEEYEGLVGAR